VPVGAAVAAATLVVMAVVATTAVMAELRSD
jgi:hypothetical protein